ncbi:FkbM family methyltransferase [Rhizobium sp. L1K21]|uniref:FkbM family methyltransferase n=1 Tax=Rhizobium sp. L1K21 TaxID=2954933 RepID=UPI002093AC5F|nr:FkbM family methyltransferase [Rhizobium sp. L1K21]MCO6185676.1 FkbM family methyltransferase [Rhizobium sp. L1K21]
MLPRVDLIRTGELDWLLLNSPDFISASIRKDGSWGALEGLLGKAFVNGRKNCVVIDAGANIGGFTLPVAKALSAAGGKIFSFEPQRIAFQQLCANAFLNRLDNVYSYNFALGNACKTISIPELDFSRSQNIGGFSIDETIRKNMREEAERGRNFFNYETEAQALIEVEQRTLDSFKIGENIAFMKIDVEGNELEVFQGAVETIARNYFPPILFEVWHGMEWFGEKAKKTTDFIGQLGYKLETFGDDILAQHPRHPFRCDIQRDGDRIGFAIRSN